jgi:hypothetical protein
MSPAGSWPGCAWADMDQDIARLRIFIRRIDRAGN